MGGQRSRERRIGGREGQGDMFIGCKEGDIAAHKRDVERLAVWNDRVRLLGERASPRPLNKG